MIEDLRKIITDMRANGFLGHELSEIVVSVKMPITRDGVQ